MSFLLVGVSLKKSSRRDKKIVLTEFEKNHQDDFVTQTNLERH